MQTPQDVQLAATALAGFLPGWLGPGGKARTGLILGTGLSDLAGAGEKVPFSSLPGFPQSSVESHAGMFVALELGGLPLLAQMGRCHLYEGRSPSEVCMGVRVMARLGIDRLIITNAAGALNPLFAAGELMCMSDFINHTGQSPLTGPNCDDLGERFPDMSCPFDPRLRELAASCALAQGIRLEQGVYIGVHGPEMETQAETRMYRQWGADAIGMSTVLEIIAARHAGMRVLGISCLSNKNIPGCMRPVPLDEIIAIAASAGEKLKKLLLPLCAALADDDRK